MLNLHCSICTELFTPADDIHATHCGHLFHILCLGQWLQRSKSCPQCRNKCTDRNIFRIYFNFANLDISHLDAGALQEQVDNANLQMKMKEKEMNKAEEQIKELKSSQKKCMKTIAGMEQKLQKRDLVIQAYNDQLKLLKTDAKLVTDLRAEIRSLKHQIDTMESVSCLLTASNDEADKLLRTENDPKKLCVWVTTLKRELRHCEHKKIDIRNMLKVVQNDLRQERELKKTLEERISLLESEKYELNEKLMSLKSGNATCIGGVSLAKDNKANTPVINLTKSPQKQSTNAQKRQTISPTIKYNIKKIEESNSPYLNIKSSSIGLVPLFKRNHDIHHPPNVDSSTIKFATLKISPTKNSSSSSSADAAARKVTEKLSIFKRPRLGLGSAAAASSSVSFLKPLATNYVFDGFGGSERVDPFKQSLDDADDEVYAEDMNRARKTVGALQKSASLSAVPPSRTLSLNNRLKSGTLRNFKLK